jgi:CMP-N-acetylneuraminic acid synthetase
MKSAEQTRIVAIVPMRHSSERVPGKNYRPFAGKPLFHHVVLNLLDCPEIDEVIIDTDSENIRESVRTVFPDVTVLERPGHLRDGMTPMNDVLLHTTSQVAAELYLQTHSTNPLLTSGTISRAINTFFTGHDEYDSLFSVKRLQSRLWGQDGCPLNHDPSRLLRTQDLPPVYEENSCIYLFSRESLLERKNRIGTRPLLFEMDAIESWDIDEEADFQVAELLYLNRQQKGGTCS